MNHEGCTDPVADLCQRQAIRIRSLEAQLERQKTINEELNRARKAINEQIRQLKRSTKTK